MKKHRFIFFKRFFSLIFLAHELLYNSLFLYLKTNDINLSYRGIVKMKKFLLIWVLFTISVSMLFLCSSVYALPSLQLGPGDTGTWSYFLGSDPGGTEDTWIVNESSFTLNAYANLERGNYC